jgi:hypothetical protein
VKPLPYAAPDRLVMLWERMTGNGNGTVITNQVTALRCE